MTHVGSFVGDRPETAVAILGGGPAGIATALTLSDLGHPVTVIERSGYDARRVGEHLSPEALPALRQLKLEHVARDPAHGQSPSIVSYWPARRAAEHPYLFGLHGHGINLCRTAFDRSLAREAIARGVVLLTDAVPCGLEGGPGEWRLTLRGGNQTGPGRTLHAKFLVDATGRAAWVARRMGERPRRHDDLVGLHGLCVARDRARRTGDALWIEASEHGWWYSAPMRGDDMVVVHMTDAEMLAGQPGGPGAVWRRRLAETPRTLERLEGFELPAKIRVALAQSQRLAHVFGRGWAAVGDAAYALDPLSASGISKALEDGIRAAEAVADALGGSAGLLERYQQRVADIFAQYLAERTAIYRLVKDWPHAPFWQCRHRPPSGTDRIWLDPAGTIVTSRAQHADGVTNSLLNQYPIVDAQQLLHLAANPVQAHHLVRMYQAGNNPCTDHEIIVVIQDLLTSGSLLRG